MPRELEPWLAALDWSCDDARMPLLPVLELDIGLLAWQLDLPFWPDERGRPFCVRPLDVVTGPHLERLELVDLAAPLDVTWQGGRWLVLDGLHRLLRAARSGLQEVPVRVVPPEALRQLAA